MDPFRSPDTPRTALVTGASRGIGEAIARKLAAEHCSLYLTCSHTLPQLQSLALELEQTFQVPVRAALCDGSDPEQVRELFDHIPSLDLLVNNAGISWVGLTQDMSDEQWDRLIRTNLSSCFYTSKRAIPLFLQRHCGRIINISSVWGAVGAAAETAYSASKGGINAFTRALGKELAPSGISVNAIACGCIDTAMNDCFSEEEKAELAAEIPADRFGRPEEVADALWALTQMPVYVTGQILTMDGGWI